MESKIPTYTSISESITNIYYPNVLSNVDPRKFSRNGEEYEIAVTKVACIIRGYLSSFTFVKTVLKTKLPESKENFQEISIILVPICKADGYLATLYNDWFNALSDLFSNNTGNLSNVYAVEVILQEDERRTPIKNMPPSCSFIKFPEMEFSEHFKMVFDNIFKPTQKAELDTPSTSNNIDSGNSTDNRLEVNGSTSETHLENARHHDSQVAADSRYSNPNLSEDNKQMKITEAHGSQEHSSSPPREIARIQTNLIDDNSHGLNPNLKVQDKHIEIPVPEHGTHEERAEPKKLNPPIEEFGFQIPPDNETTTPSDQRTSVPSPPLPMRNNGHVDNQKSLIVLFSHTNIDEVASIYSYFAAENQNIDFVLVPQVDQSWIESFNHEVLQLNSQDTTYHLVLILIHARTDLVVGSRQRHIRFSATYSVSLVDLVSDFLSNEIHFLSGSLHRALILASGSQDNENNLENNADVEKIDLSLAHVDTSALVGFSDVSQGLQGSGTLFLRHLANKLNIHTSITSMLDEVNASVKDYDGQQKSIYHSTFKGNVKF